jgi:hypothetical protein
MSNFLKRSKWQRDSSKIKVQIRNLSLLASEYLNSKEVSTMYFLICWGLFISKIALLQYMCVGRLGSLVEKLKFSIKDPPKKVIVSRISFLGWSLMENFSFSFKDPPKNQYVIFETRVFTCQQCEYNSSASDVLGNAVIIPQNWEQYPSPIHPPQKYRIPSIYILDHESELFFFRSI